MISQLKVTYGDAITLQPPSDSSAIRTAEQAIGICLPDELRDALLESDGVTGKYGEGLLWSVSRIAEDNLLFRCTEGFRELYMPFDALLFFGDAANGDQFAFPILDGEVRRSDVFVWNHEDDSRTWIAPSLERFYEWWMTGRISI